jgi:hypothetical protein
MGSSIAVDATSVYYSAHGTIMTVPVGGGPPTTLASGQDSNLVLAVGNSSVFWTYGGTVMFAPK